MQSPYTTVLAPNASPMTGPGTTSIILGGGAEGAMVIDPAEHEQAYLETLIREGEQRGGIRRILITHGHPDHIGGATALRQRLNVPIYAFSRQGTTDADVEVPDGTVFPAGEDTLRAIYTPGHRFDHLCFLLEQRRTLFAGDLVAGVGTVVIIPPEGDMQQYLDSLRRLQAMSIAEIVPAHGPIVSDPRAKLSEYVAHRLQREQQVQQVLSELPAGTPIPELVRHIYADVDPRLHGMAAMSVEAHLIKLEREGRASRVGDGWAGV